MSNKKLKLAAANRFNKSKKRKGMKRNVILWLVALLTCAGLRAQQKHEGIASYYHDRFHGRRTSSGSIYHKDSLTCAHRTLPFGTRLRVKSLRNGKEVVVRVTDRGPFTRRFMIDLSRAAAKELDFIRAGICRVEITVLPPEEKAVTPPPATADPLPEDTPQQPDTVGSEP